MKPSLAAHLVETFTTPGGRMLDPFSGVGTIPFEAALHGVECWGFDISPPAVHITAGKVEKYNAVECEGIVKRLEKYLKNYGVREDERKSAAAIRFNGVLTSYFHKRTLEEVLLARRYFLDNPPAKRFAVSRISLLAAYPSWQSSLCAQSPVASNHAVCAERRYGIPCVSSPTSRQDETQSGNTNTG